MHSDEDLNTPPTLNAEEDTQYLQSIVDELNKKSKEKDHVIEEMNRDLKKMKLDREEMKRNLEEMKRAREAIHCAPVVDALAAGRRLSWLEMLNDWDTYRKRQPSAYDSDEDGEDHDGTAL